MHESSRTNKELFAENASLKQRIKELERAESDYKRAQEEQRVSDVKYKILFDQAINGIMIMPVDGTNFIVNKSFAKLHGYDSPKEMEHLILSDIDTPETAKLAPERLRRLIAGELMNCEVEHYHKDGHKILLEVSCNVVQIDGKPHFLGFHNDITARKRAEEALRRVNDELEQRIADRTKALRTSEEQYDFLIRNTTDYVCRYSQSGILLFGSDALYSITGYKPEEVIGANAFNRVHPDDRSQVQAALKEAIETGVQRRLEFRADYKGGGYKWVEMSGKAVHNDETGQIEIVAVIRDITERKLAETQLWENQERLRLALQAGKQGYHDLDVQNDNLYYSDRFLEIVGYSRDELEPRVRSWKKLVHPQDKTKVFPIIKEHFDGRSDHCEATYRLKTKSGEWRWVRAHAEIVKRDDNGRPLRMMGTITNATSEKEIEQELEKRVEERTAELVEVNAALKVLLKQREQDKTDTEETMAANLKLMVLPYLHKLKTSHLNDQLKAWVSLIDENLDKVSSPFIKKLHSRYSVLTPKELQVAEHIRSGKTSKEIAEMMNLSPRTVDVFRYSLRKKLGLNNKKTNLQSLLSSQ